MDSVYLNLLKSAGKISDGYLSEQAKISILFSHRKVTGVRNCNIEPPTPTPPIALPHSACTVASGSPVITTRIDSGASPEQAVANLPAPTIASPPSGILVQQPSLCTVIQSARSTLLKTSHLLRSNSHDPDIAESLYQCYRHLSDSCQSANFDNGRHKLTSSDINLIGEKLADIGKVTVNGKPFSELVKNPAARSTAANSALHNAEKKSLLEVAEKMRRLIARLEHFEKNGKFPRSGIKRRETVIGLLLGRRPQ